VADASLLRSAPLTEERTISRGDRKTMTVHDHSTRSSGEPVTQWTPPAGSQPPGSSPPGPPPPVGSAEPGRKKRNPKVAIAGALVAVAIASGGITAGIMAATGRGNGNSVTGAPSGAGFGGGRGGGFGGGSAMAALHGTYVVSDGNGGYSTELTQTGTVSAVSSSAITVKSEDGYSKTYAITSSTSVDNGSDQIGSVVAGHTVRIVADSKASATAITDTNLSGGQNQGGQNQGGQNQGGQNVGGQTQGGSGQGNGQPPGQ
jgi:hypothetical protein